MNLWSNVHQILEIQQQIDFMPKIKFEIGILHWQGR